MNATSDNAPLNDSRFDRLVDGELSEQERRQLLEGLDRQPGGWRRCALAFLEAQCWKQTFAADSRPSSLPKIEAPAARLPRSRWTHRVGTALAMAASFLIVFWIGSFAERTMLDRSAGPLAQNEPPRAVGHAAPDAAGSKPWQMVTLASPSGSKIRMPAAERNRLDPQWLDALPSAVPDDVLQAFNRTGHQVQQRRELVPIPLGDGRQMVVPVDQVDVHYTGNTTY